MKHLILICIFLVSCGGGDQQTLPDPNAITVDDLHENVRQEYVILNGIISCDIPYQCGDIVAFDCGSMVDGPKNYYNNVTGEIVMLCGGACQTYDPTNPIRCKVCPPDEWICEDIH